MFSKCTVCILLYNAVYKVCVYSSKKVGKIMSKSQVNGTADASQYIDSIGE